MYMLTFQTPAVDMRTIFVALACLYRNFMHLETMNMDHGSCDVLGSIKCYEWESVYLVE